MDVPTMQTSEDVGAFHRGGVSVEEHISSALDNAIENGHPIHTWTALAITLDFLDYDSGCEGLSSKDVLPVVEQWLAQNRR